jgi:2'-5' RNA ligase
VTARRHAMLFPTGAALGEVEALRRAWDPTMAAQIAAHITVAYPDEHPGLAALRERIASVAASHAPFRLGLGDVRAFPPPNEGCIYLEVLDIGGGYAALREALTAPPFRPIAFPPHVTIIHPRTSRRAAEFWRIETRQREALEITIDSIAITSSDGADYAVEARFPLSGSGG